MTDKQFMNFFAVILGILIAIAIVIFIIASSLSNVSNGLDVNMEHHVKERLKPIGRVNIEGATPAEALKAPTQAAQTPAMPAAASMDMQTAYDTVCAACHSTGIANSPVLGDQAAWAPRIAAGIETLYTSALQGKGAAMPAKGGRPDISDDIIRQIVDYMVEASR